MNFEKSLFSAAYSLGRQRDTCDKERRELARKHRFSKAKMEVHLAIKNRVSILAILGLGGCLPMVVVDGTNIILFLICFTLAAMSLLLSIPIVISTKKLKRRLDKFERRFGLEHC